MKTSKKRFYLHPLMWVVVGLSIFSAAIFTVALLIPPEGEVHATALKGLSLQTLNIVLVIFAYSIVSGKTATFTHGKTNVSVGSKQTDEDKE